jgi:hypothetical protein
MKPAVVLPAVVLTETPLIVETGRGFIMTGRDPGPLLPAGACADRRGCDQP